MQVVILAGGKSLRLRPISPKPLAKIGNKPIIWHVMKIYKAQGYNDFLILLGYGHKKIRNYLKKVKEFNITSVFTGYNVETGGRIKKAEKYLEDEFFLTYSDGLGNVDLKALLRRHRRLNKICTITTVNPQLQYGIVLGNYIVRRFIEKPVLNNMWINAGFMACKKKIVDYIESYKDKLEVEVFNRLVKDRQLAIYRHKGFWVSMDNLKDYLRLNKMWKENKAGWKIW